MRLKLALFAAATALTVVPTASAQAGYYGYGGPRDVCREERRDNQAAGLILGGILGGVLGSNVAASGHRHDGTALGAVLGGVVGSEMGRGSTQCRTATNTYGAYPTAGYPAPPLETRPYGGYPDPGYDGYDPRYSEGRYADDEDYLSRGERLDGYDRRSYKSSHDNGRYAGSECVDVTTRTRLPDGSVLTRPAEACRTARYGDWRVRD